MKLKMPKRKEVAGNIRFIIGTYGSGKSFLAKQEIVKLKQNGKKEIIIIDPYKEYGFLCNNTANHIDLSKQKKLSDIQEFCSTFQTFLYDKTEGTILAITYKCFSDKITENLFKIIPNQIKPDVIVLNTNGIPSLNMESCYLFLLDFIKERALRNEKRGIETHVYIENCCVFRETNTSRIFMNMMHEIIMHNCFITAISAEIGTILDYIEETKMNQDDYIFHLFKQSKYDNFEMKKRLYLSDEQIEYITNVEQGQALIIKRNKKKKKPLKNFKTKS